MLNFITPSTNIVHLSLTGNSPETVLRDLLDKLTQEQLENLSVTLEDSQEVYRLDDNLYLQEIYRLTFTTPATAQKLDPDAVA